MENEIKDAEFEFSNEGKNEGVKKKKNFKTELILFLVLGFLLGVVIKTEAGKRITIGFEDYKISALQRGYDLNQIKKNVDERARVDEIKNEEIPESSDDVSTTPNQ